MKLICNWTGRHKVDIDQSEEHDLRSRRVVYNCVRCGEELMVLSERDAQQLFATHPDDNPGDGPER